MLPIPHDKLLLAIPLLLIPILPNLWGIWHTFRNDFETPQEKMLWIWLNTLVPVLGGVLYLLIGRRRIKKGNDQ
ncbi:MAG: PLDc_N domain-containing protein [Deltaproteobacteria bacterium]|nr:PLDc_N domain-containing protein [Deltaproteobacteria bacterium]